MAEPSLATISPDVSGPSAGHTSHGSVQLIIGPVGDRFGKYRTVAVMCALATVLVFFSVFFNAFQGTREVDQNLISNARILGASPWRVTTQVVLPSALGIGSGWS